MTRVFPRPAVRTRHPVPSRRGQLPCRVLPHAPCENAEGRGIDESVNDCRVTLELLLAGQRLVPIDIGSHDEVYWG